MVNYIAVKCLSSGMIRCDIDQWRQGKIPPRKGLREHFRNDWQILVPILVLLYFSTLSYLSIVIYIHCLPECALSTQLPGSAAFREASFFTT